MTFNLISVAVLLVAALIILIEVVRAIRRGRNKTLVTLASLFLATFLSIIATRFISDIFAGHVLRLITKMFDISEISEKIPSIENILFAYSDSIIAPALFLLVFILMRIIIAIVVKIVYKANEGKQENKKYESEESPRYKRSPKLTNGLLGALCGFVAVVIFISPAMGTLKTVTNTFKNMNEQPKLFNMKIKQSAVDYFDKCSNDFVGNIVYYCGGNIIYASVASSDLNDNYFGLLRELENTFKTAGNLLLIDNYLNRIDTATEEEKQMLRDLGGEVDKAETLKAATSDIIPVLAKKWLNDEEYEGNPKPKVGKTCESFFDKMLYVCKSSTPDTVGADLSSLLNVYLIAYENGILASENYKEMVEKAKSTGAFELIKQELNKNPRMAGISLDIDTMGVKTIASALQSFNFENYETLMGDITNTLNNAMNLDGQEQLDYVTNLTKDYIHKYGIDVGDDVANEVAKRLIDELVDHREAVTVDDLKEFWDKYSVKKKETNSMPNIPSDILTPPQGTDDENGGLGDIIDGELGDIVDGELGDIVDGELGDIIDGEFGDIIGDQNGDGVVDENDLLIDEPSYEEETHGYNY